MTRHKRVYGLTAGNPLSVNIKTLREAKGLTFAALARKAGVVPHTIMRLEKYGDDAKLSLVQSVAKALGVLTSELLGEMRTPLTPRETQLVMLYRKLNVTMRKRFLYVGMGMAGEMDDEEQEMRRSADWSRPTEGRDPIQEMKEKALARGEKRVDLDRFNEILVDLGSVPGPDGVMKPYVGQEVHERVMAEFREEYK